MFKIDLVKKVLAFTITIVLMMGVIPFQCINAEYEEYYADDYGAYDDEPSTYEPDEAPEYDYEEEKPEEEYDEEEGYEESDYESLIDIPYLPISPFDTAIHEVYSEDSLAAAWAAIGDITIVLTGDFTMVVPRTIAPGRHVTIVSDGQANRILTGANAQRHFTVQAGGVLTLGVDGDSNANNFSLVGSGVSINSPGGIISVTDAALNMYGGTITGGRSHSSTAGGGAIHFNRSVFNMYDGIIEDNHTSSASSGGGGGVNLIGASEFNMHGGVIRNNTSVTTGGGVAVHGGNGSPANFTMFGGEIYGNIASGNNHGGGGVNVTGNGGHFTIYSGAVIHSNRATGANTAENRPGGGGGVRIWNTTNSAITLNMNGAQIRDNEATGAEANGGGVLLGTDTILNMYAGASIVGNEANGNGGGVATSNSSSRGVIINLNSGEISANTSHAITDTSGGGGIFMRGMNSVITMQDDFVMRGNAAVYGGAIRIRPNAASSATHNHLVMNGGLIDNNSATRSGGGVHIYSAQRTAILMNGGTISNNTAEQGGGVATSSSNSNGSAFIMNGGNISGNTANGANGGGGIFMQGTGGVFVMEDGAVIESNTAIRGGGICLIPNSASISPHYHFVMNGGLVDSNTATTGNGGGMYLHHNVHAQMNGGAISRNVTTLGNGGGIASAASSTGGLIFDMFGGEIYENTAIGTSGGWGGGVFLQGGRSVFTMEQGSAIHNNSARYGGGVRMQMAAAMPSSGEPGGVFNLNGGEIRNNSATSTGTSGAGVHMNVATTFNMSSGAIRNNVTPGNGGGVTSNAENRGIEFNFSGGEISGNIAGGANGGGGVLLQGRDTLFNMSGNATISGNNAMHGGGARINSGTFNMHGGTISGNSTVTSVQINGDDITLNGNGGGVFLATGLPATTVAAFNMSSGTIANNVALNGAGLGFNTSSLLNPPFVPFLERVTIGNAAVFENNIATGGSSVNTTLRDQFTSTIEPSIVTYGEHAFNNHDLHMPTQPTTIRFLVVNDSGVEIELHSFMLDGVNFNSAEHLTEFPSIADVNNSVDYTNRENEFGFGFNEWGFTNRWRVNHPITGDLIDLGATSSTFNITPATSELRLYAQTGQLLIVDDASLREAINRTSPGVPAMLVIQNSFDVLPIGTAAATPSIIIPSGHDITLVGRDGANLTYSRSLGNMGYDEATQRHFVVEGAATLRLNNITLAGNHPATNVRHGGVLVENSARLYVNEGTIIENNRAIYGGGIFLRVPPPYPRADPTSQPDFGGGGYVVIDGAIIRNNRAENFGGGISATGFIIDHRNPDFLPGLPSRTPDQLVTIIIRGSSDIHDNSAHYGGGGAMAQHFSRIIMEAGTIRDNETRGWGGGVRFHNGGSFIMYGGEISGNTANYGGGGIAGGSGPNAERMAGVAVFDMFGGSVSSNNVTGAVLPGEPYSSFLGGGGVMIDGFVTFTMNDGQIHDNLVPTTRVTAGLFAYNPFGMGGGVFLNHGATFILNNGTIRDNQAYRGGGIHVATIEVMSDGIPAYERTWLWAQNANITGNIATENGGGIFATFYPNIRVSRDVVFDANRAVSLHSFFNYPTFGGTFVVESGLDSGEGQGGYAGWSNINWSTLSIPYTHALNNYDINFIWTPPHPEFLRVVFNPNGGQFTGEQQLPIRAVERDGTYALAFNAADNLVRYDLAQPTRQGYSFGGWFNSQAEADNLSSQAGRILYSQHHTNVDMRMLWARWIPGESSNPGGGNGVNGDNNTPTPSPTPSFTPPWVSAPPPTQNITIPPTPQYRLYSTPPVIEPTPVTDRTYPPETTPETPETEITTEIMPPRRSNPQTGDNSNVSRAIILNSWFLLAILAAFVAARKAGAN